MATRHAEETGLPSYVPFNVTLFLQNKMFDTENQGGGNLQDN